MLFAFRVIRYGIQKGTGHRRHPGGSMRQQRSQRKAYLFFLVLLALVFDSQSIHFSNASRLGTAQLLPFVQNGEQSYRQVIYSSRNLEGHEIFAECNPGGGTNCACSGEDVRVNAYEDFGEVISNVRGVNTYVNAIGFWTRESLTARRSCESISSGLGE
jgi:hypothetical protein